MPEMPSEKKVVLSEPMRRQRSAQLLTGYGAIALRRVGNKAIVEIEAYPGKWLEVMAEDLDSCFSQIIEPLGIEAIMKKAGYDPSKGPAK